MNVIHRPTFEARLRAQMANDYHDDEADPAWYAIRNVVYAFGLRILVQENSSENKWVESQIHGWKYFQNAFSVHSELIYSRSTIAAVQALFAMVCIWDHTNSILLNNMTIGYVCRGTRIPEA